MTRAELVRGLVVASAMLGVFPAAAAAQLDAGTVDAHDSGAALESDASAGPSETGPDASLIRPSSPGEEHEASASAEADAASDAPALDAGAGTSSDLAAESSGAATRASELDDPRLAVATPAREEPAVEASAPAPAWGLQLGDVRFAPSGEVWLRGELRVDGPARGGVEEYFVASRIRLGLDVRWEFVRVFVQAQDARMLGQFVPGDPNGAATSFQQGWVQLGHDDLFLRAGRQQYALGGERMIGPLLWANAARAFDALRLHGAWGNVQADVVGAFTRMPRTIVQTGGGPPAQSEGDYLGVARVAWTPGAELTLEPYVLFRHDGPLEVPLAAPDPTPFLTRERNIANFGVRGTGLLAGVMTYELEAMLQAGRAEQQDHLAFALVANVGARLGTPAGLTVIGGVNYGSGAAADGSVDEFDNFFPTNHLFYGFADYFGLRNVVDGWARILTAPVEIPQLRLWLDAHLFAFPEASGRWTPAGGGQIAGATTTPDGFAGGEIDLELRWTPVDSFFVWAGYALFIPASGAQLRGVTDPSHWAYLMLGATLPE